MIFGIGNGIFPKIRKKPANQGVPNMRNRKPPEESGGLTLIN
jgi:hypothetical protein